MDSEWTFLPQNNTPGLVQHTPGEMALLSAKGLHDVSPNFDRDQFLLHQAEQSLYEQPGGVAGTTTGPHALGDASDLREFDLDDIDFIVPTDLKASSKAFPPLDFPENTPSLLPNSHQGHRILQSPMLPGQNDKSYNDEHLYHKQRQQRQQRHVRPDAVFTPLVSPAVTPLDSQVNSNKQQFAVQTAFEPLTSPALNAQQALATSDRRRPLSVMYGPEDSYSGTTKRRTPHSTPNLTAQMQKRSPTMRKVNQPFDLLPDSGYLEGFKGYDNGSEKAYNHDYDGGYKTSARSTETTPMLPPQGKKVLIDTPNSGVGPATLMGFTMNRLAELQSNPSSSPSPSLAAQKDRPRNNSVSNSSSRSSSYAGKPYIKHETSLSETSPIIDPQSGETTGYRREKPSTKKTSHKLAEQGRRNRMNQAVYELGKLIPPSLHEQVSIPSKATTVELAATYITFLEKEVEELKRAKEEA